ncbi:uncharacterized protein LOC135689752 [Rhopilema esculentum]|uniref:uncharacterized protein LOC135689752 n=1 Tax=Rhopilema esculentum TaxID=499914 RepID=UPI0031CF7531
MRSETLSGTIKSPRPNSSVSSYNSGRNSKQSLLRSYDLKTFERQTLMTPQGFKTVKIYAASDDGNNSMKKYRQRPRTAIGIMSSKDEDKLKKTSERVLQRASSANILRSQTNNHSQLDEIRPKTAMSRSSSASSSQSSSSRQVIYNNRHSMCTPPNLYLHDDLRLTARSQRPISAPRECDECSSVERYNTVQRRRRAKSADAVERFGTRVECPKFVRGNPFLTNDELDAGQKQYIWGMARVYSVDKLKSLRQRHYQSILNYEYIKRVMTKGVEEKDRVKLGKEYAEYQKVINRFGKDPARLKSVQFPSRYAAPHCHAKKHRVTGWTTEFTDVSTQSTESEENIDEDSFIYSDDGSGATADESQAMGEEKLYPETHRGKERPKSSKYRIRKPAPSPNNQKTSMVTENMQIEETLSREVNDKLIISHQDENFI